MAGGQPARVSGHHCGCVRLKGNRLGLCESTEEPHPLREKYQGIIKSALYASSVQEIPCPREDPLTVPTDRACGIYTAAESDRAERF